MRFKILIFLFALSSIVFMGTLPAWNTHLAGDAIYYDQAAKYFFFQDQNPFAKLPTMYPPGANLFFLLVSLLPLQSFETSLVAVNCILLVILFFIFRRNTLTYSLIVLFAGPIMLFRFDLAVIFLTILSFKLFKRNKYFLSGFFLGIGIVTKAYPLVMIPLYLISLLSKKQYSASFRFALAVTTGIIMPLGLFLVLTGGNFAPLAEVITFQSEKLIHIESVPGTLLTFLALFQHPIPPTPEFINGIASLSWQYLLGRDRLIKYFGPTINILVYTAILFSFRRVQKFDVKIIIVVLLVMLVTSNVLSPQYLLWIFLLVPLVPSQELTTSHWKINTIIIITILALTQFVYPLNYQEFYWIFYQTWGKPWIFFTLLLRNILLLIICARIMILLNRED